MQRTTSEKVFDVCLLCDDSNRVFEPVFPRIGIRTVETTMMRLSMLIAIVMANSMAAAGDPALPGHHPLTQAQAGSVLISELRCARVIAASSAIPRQRKRLLI